MTEATSHAHVIHFIYLFNKYFLHTYGVSGSVYVLELQRIWEHFVCLFYPPYSFLSQENLMSELSPNWSRGSPIIPVCAPEVPHCQGEALGSSLELRRRG